MGGPRDRSILSHTPHSPPASFLPPKKPLGDGVNRPGSGGGGGSGDDESAGAPPAELGALLAAGKTLSSLPPDFAAALQAGRIPADVLDRYLKLSAGILAPLLRVGGFRERLLADPSFMVKVAIEVGIGILTKSTAEYTKRGDRFSSEIDFVAANVAMALVADFMLVWLPAPTLSLAGRGAATAAKNPIMSFFASCPDNAFMKVPSGATPFTLAQRGGAVVRNGAKLLGVGFGASLLGVGATNALIAVRGALDPSWSPPNAPQDVLTMSAAYASYMAVSSNLRYQILAGVVEERGIETLLAGRPGLCNVLSFAVRTGNTFLGSLMWVDYLRLLGLQKAPGS